MHPIVNGLRGGIVVSCQAHPADVIYGAEAMALMARAAEAGGAVGIRANGPADVTAIRQAVGLPILGIYKQDLPGYGVRITPTLDAARQIVSSGADIIALDATRRGAEEGRLPAADLIRLVKETLRVPVMADIATFEEGVAAAEAGADIVATTLSGYTAYSPATAGPDFDLVARLVSAVQVPVIAEGRIASPADARRILELGGYAVVVGSMITRPKFVVEQYMAALRAAVLGAAGHPAAPVEVQRQHPARVVAIDIGGTKIAGGVVDHPVGITLEQTTWTNARQGGQAVLSRAMKMIGDLLKQAEGVAAIGVATAGEVGADGDIIYATNNIPGYKGIAVRREIEARFGLPTAVDNDGRCAALGEALAGAGQGYHSVLGVTVGTGIGGGFVIEGRPYAGAGRVGAHLGHILVEKGGKLCSCGKHGCLEAYVCGPALVEDYNQRTSLHVMSGEAVMNAARSGNLAAAATIREMGERLGYGLASAANLFNPGVIVIGGGMSQIGGMFFEPVRAAFRDWTYPTVADTPILPAQLGSRAELIGAAILARQRLAGRSA